MRLAHIRSYSSTGRYLAAKYSLASFTPFAPHEERILSKDGTLDFVVARSDEG